MSSIRSSKQLVTPISNSYPLIKFPSTEALAASTASARIFPSDINLRARWAPEGMSNSGTTFTWLDASGNGYTASKTGGNLPTIITGLNGENAAQGTNSTDRRLLVTNSANVISYLSRTSMWGIFQTPTTPQNLQAVFEVLGIVVLTVAALRRIFST